MNRSSSHFSTPRHHNPAILVTAIFVSVLAIAAYFSTPAAAESRTPESIAIQLEQTGRYLETTKNVQQQINAANSQGIAFVAIDESGSGDTTNELANRVLETLGDSSNYHTVVVYFDGGQGSSGYGASSNIYSDGEIDAAIDQAIDSIQSGDSSGLDRFKDSLAGAEDNGALAPGTSSSSSSVSTGGSSGFGIGSLLFVVALVGAPIWWLLNRRKKKAAAQSDLETDRQEISKQLQDNADRVIELGDKVIEHNDQELIDKYEEASQTYQDVSRAVPDAVSAEEIDALDDRIDHAQWQLEAIEATLKGEPVPPSPAEIATQESEAKAKERQSRRPALQQDDSVFGGRNSHSGVGNNGGGMGGLGGIIFGGGRGPFGGRGGYPGSYGGGYGSSRRSTRRHENRPRSRPRGSGGRTFGGSSRSGGGSGGKSF